MELEKSTEAHGTPVSFWLTLPLYIIAVMFHVENVISKIDAYSIVWVQLVLFTITALVILGISLIFVFAKEFRKPSWVLLAAILNLAMAATGKLSY